MPIVLAEVGQQAAYIPVILLVWTVCYHRITTTLHKRDNHYSWLLRSTVSSHVTTLCVSVFPLSKLFLRYGVYEGFALSSATEKVICNLAAAADSFLLRSSVSLEHKFLHSQDHSYNVLAAFVEKIHKCLDSMGNREKP